MPLSDEEQLLLFQQKMLAEEEMAKKKERLLSQFLKVMAFCITLCPTPPHSLHWSCRLDPLIVAACFHAGLPSSGNLETQVCLDFWQDCLGEEAGLCEARRGASGLEVEGPN